MDESVRGSVPPAGRAAAVPPVGRAAAVPPVVHRVGGSALLVEVPAADVPRWYAELELLRRSGEVVDVVPAARTVLLDGVADVAGVAARVAALDPPPLAAVTGAPVHVDVHYDGEDLDEVARLWGPDRAGAVAVHTGTVFRVAFTGFAPGFGYLSGLPPERHVPRRATPRTRVPAGSVALAGGFSGIYPTASPGGWQLIGWTGATLWDTDRDPPALFVPGAVVRFRDAGPR